MTGERRVGPVLSGCMTGRAVARAVVASNDGARLVDRGGYLRVLAPAPCCLIGRDVREHLGEAFELPGDLEAVMTSFTGRLVMEDDAVRWE